MVYCKMLEREFETIQLLYNARFDRMVGMQREIDDLKVENEMIKTRVVGKVSETYLDDQCVSVTIELV